MFVQDAQPTTRIEIVEHHQSNHPGELGRSFRVYCWVNEYNPIGDIMNGERWNKPHKDIAPLLQLSLRSTEYLRIPDSNGHSGQAVIADAVQDLLCTITEVALISTSHTHTRHPSQIINSEF